MLAALSKNGAVPAASDAHPNFKYSASGKHNFNAGFSEAYEFTTDGTAPASTSKSGVVGTWEGRVLVLRYVKGPKELFTFRFRLSSDGKQMTREADLNGDRKIREIYDREP